MSRRRRPEKRVILPDPRYGDLILSKFMNNLMLDGKKSAAERIVYGALETVEQRAKKDPVQTFHEALDNVSPVSKSAAAASVVRPIRCLSKFVRSAPRLWLSAG